MFEESVLDPDFNFGVANESVGLVRLSLSLSERISPELVEITWAN